MRALIRDATAVGSTRSGILLEKLIIPQLFKKFSTSCGTEMLMFVFTRSRHWSYPEPDE
jgi:hypothetical protein